MKTSVAILLLGLCSQHALGQINPAMFLMGGGAGGLGPMGSMAALGGGMEMQELMNMQMMSQMYGGGAAGGGAGGAGGIDPTMMLMLGGGAGGGMMGNDMMTTMMMMNMLNQGQGQSQAQGQGQGQAQGQGQGQAQTQGGGMGSQIAQMLGDMGTGIAPAQQEQIWMYLNMNRLTPKIMEAVASPIDRVQLERDGVMGITEPQMMFMLSSMCPAPTGCRFPLCEATEIPFSPESFYVCRGCPRCRLDTSQQSLFNLMQNRRGRGGNAAANDMAQNLAMMRMAGGGGGSNIQTLALLNSLQQPQPQPQPQLPQLPQLPPQPQAPPQSPAAPLTATQMTAGAPPSPEFIAFIKQRREQMRTQNQASRPAV